MELVQSVELLTKSMEILSKGIEDVTKCLSEMDSSGQRPGEETTKGADEVRKEQNASVAKADGKKVRAISCEGCRRQQGEVNSSVIKRASSTPIVHEVQENGGKVEIPVSPVAPVERSNPQKQPSSRAQGEYT